MQNHSRGLRVGLWPAYARGSNSFVDMFTEGLRLSGAETIDFDPGITTSIPDIDILHIHWPEQVFWYGGGPWSTFFRLLRTLKNLNALKGNGVIIVWMVHNLAPHDLSVIRRPLWWFYKYCLYTITDGFMTLSPGTIDVVRQALTGLMSKPVEYVWHPAYPRFDNQIRPRADIRAQLGLSMADRVYALLGLLRPYKGIESLIDVFKTSIDQAARLLIVGSPITRSYGELLRKKVAFDNRIFLQLGHIPDLLYAEYLHAADLIVLPFQKILHSGSIIHALSEGRPVLTCDTAYSRSLRDQVGPEWVLTYEGDVARVDFSRILIPKGAPELKEFSIAEAGKRSLKFYKKLINMRSSTNA